MAAPTTARRRTALAPAPRPQPTRAPRPPLRLVDARQNVAFRRRRARLIAVVGAVLATGTLFLLAAFNAMLVTGQSRIDHLQSKVQEAQAEYSANRLQLAQLQAPERIVQAARDRLGMVPPPGVTYLTPSEALAAQVEHGREAPTTTSRDDGGTSWAATKPYLGATP
jgi:cell division protein FtsL